jgi:hypothetical protein
MMKAKKMKMASTKTKKGSLKSMIGKKIKSNY